MDGSSAQPQTGAGGTRLDEMPPPIIASGQRPLGGRPGVPPPAPGAKLNTNLDMVTGHWCQASVSIEIAPSQFYELVTQAVMERKIPGVEFSRVYWKEEAFVGANREYLRIQRGRLVFDICAAPKGAGSFFSSWLCMVPLSISGVHLLGILAGMILTIAMAGMMSKFVVAMSVVFYVISLFASFGVWGSLGTVLITDSLKVDFLVGLTGLGPMLKFLSGLRPTYYQIDAAQIFQSTVQDAMLGVIDKLCEQQNARPLTEHQRASVLREFMKK